MKNNINRDKVTIAISNLVKIKKYEEALNLLKNLSDQKEDQDFSNKIRGLIYLNQKDWEKSLIYHNKISKEKINFEISNNIGIALFKLGRFSEASDKFKESIENKNENIPAYENFCMTNKLLGNYELTIKYSLIALKLMPSNKKIINNLIDILNYFEPKKNEYIILNINDQIKKLDFKKNKNLFISNFEINKIFDKSEEILKNNNFFINYPQTQIFKKNSVDLNCGRHLSIFSKHKIIPKFCFNCYKIQITLDKVLDLIKLHFYLSRLKLEQNNIRKCIVELRDNIAGNYKGYVFCNSISDAENIKRIVTNDLKSSNINIENVEIKHGCSEYYDEFKIYKNIKENVMDKIYKKEWAEIERKFDEENYILENNKEKVFDETINLFCLPDLLIMKNWLIYAKIIGDESYKDIYKVEVNTNHLSQLEVQKISMRKK